MEGWDLPSLNEETKETDPDEALGQAGTVMRCNVRALATATLSEDPIHFSKLDIKYGLCRMVCAIGEE